MQFSIIYWTKFKEKHSIFLTFLQREQRRGFILKLRRRAEAYFRPIIYLTWDFSPPSPTASYAYAYNQRIMQKYGCFSHFCESVSQSIIQNKISCFLILLNCRCAKAGIAGTWKDKSLHPQGFYIQIATVEVRYKRNLWVDELMKERKNISDLLSLLIYCWIPACLCLYYVT